MLDMKLIRKDPKGVEARVQKKDPSLNFNEVLQKDQKLREVITEVEELQSKRNQLSKEIGEKKRGGEDASSLMEEVGEIGKKITILDKARDELAAELNNKLAYFPNLPVDELTVSQNPDDNVCIKEVGEKPSFPFSFKNHVELNENLHLFDFKAGAKTTGSNWVFYTNLGARLEWALINYMIDIHVDNDYTQIVPPLLAHPDILYGAAQLPKFAEQMYHLDDKDHEYYLIPTSEVILNGMYADEIIKKEELPKKYFAYSPCFRREAGAAGAGERGLIRMHQFNKVEMFSFTTPEQSNQVFEEFVTTAEEILQGLGLHYRLCELVTGDTSFAAAKTVDVEVWLPGQNRYYEVSSISNCTDFQARRAHIRYKHKAEKPEYVHTLNGSGLATPRLMVAILENFQQEDGSIQLPIILHKYMNGIKKLG